MVSCRKLWFQLWRRVDHKQLGLWSLVWLEIWEQLSSVGSLLYACWTTGAIPTKKVIQTMQCCPPFSELETMVGHKPQQAHSSCYCNADSLHCALNEYYLSKSRSDQIKSNQGSGSSKFWLFPWKRDNWKLKTNQHFSIFKSPIVSHTLKYPLPISL